MNLIEIISVAAKLDSTVRPLIYNTMKIYNLAPKIAEVGSHSDPDTLCFMINLVR